MTRRILLLLATVFALCANALEWHPDTLGHDLQYAYINQPDDYAGKVRCTIVRSDAAGSDCNPFDNTRAILYIHGYNDYFFQTALADSVTSHCWRFYALDLRKYGRSILDGNKRFQARDLNEYFADIDSALSVMHSEGVDAVVLMAHSTGGLIASYYMQQHPSPMVRGMILNSPFLEWNMNGFMRKVAVPAVGCLGRHFPNLDIPQGGGSAYSESLLKKHHGEWDYNTSWKLEKSQPVEASWIGAIDRAQGSLQNGGDIGVPILLMHSARSVNTSKWTPECQQADAVLNVKDISKIGRKLGPNVTEATFEGGLHDLILSSPQVRRQVYATMFRWLDSHF